MLSKKTKTALAAAIVAVIAFLGAYLVDLNADIGGSEPTTSTVPTTTVAAPTSTTTRRPTTTPPATTPPATTTTQPPATTAPPEPTTTPSQPAQHVPGGPDGRGGFWPGVDNTGPVVEPTQVYPNPPGGGRIALRDGDVIDGKIIDNEVVVIGRNTVIRNSIVKGRIDADCANCSLTLENSTVNAGSWGGTAVGFQNLTIRRSEIRGGTASVSCSNCVIEDSYLHDQFAGNGSHNAAYGNNGGGNVTLRHNTLHCTPVGDQQSGCTGDMAIHGDFAPLKNFLFEANLFPATPSGGYCAGFGWSTAKPYGADPQGIRVINNVVQRGPNGKCGIWGPDTSFKPSGAGNVWTGNTWDDGTPWNHS